MVSSFYADDELLKIGFRSVGEDVLVSSKASIYGAENIVLGDHVRIDDFCFLSGKITIGSYVHISAYSMLIGGKYGIVMKDFSGLSSRCTIYAVSDDYSGAYLTNPTIPEKYSHLIGGEVVLNKHVIVGTGSTILSGINIGEGTAVGSMTLVNRNLEEWSIYAGIPCKKIKDRKQDLLNFEKKMFHSEI